MTANQKCCIPKCTTMPIMTCLGCPGSIYCSSHYKEHRENLNKQLKDLTHLCQTHKADFETQMQNPQAHSLMEIVDRWEQNSIKEIKRIAEETRQELLPRVTNFIPQMNIKLNNLIDELGKKFENDAFVDTDIRSGHEKLEILKQMLKKPPNFTVIEETTPFISKIQLKLLDIPNIPVTARWMQNGVTVAGSHANNNEENYLHHPQGIFLDDDETMLITERYSHHVVQWKIGDTTKQIIDGSQHQQNDFGQLRWATNILIDKVTDSLIICDHGNERVIRWPRRTGTAKCEIVLDNVACYGLLMDCQGCLYVSDTEKHEVRKYQQLADKTGTIVAGGNGIGDGLNQLSYPTYIFVDQHQAVYVSDRDNHRVMKWNKNATEGMIVAGNGIEGNSLAQLYNPSGLFVDTMGTVYVVDTGNDRVMRWHQGATQGTIIAGGNDQGEAANQLWSPEGLCFDRHGNLYVVDNYNNRIQRFSIQ